MDRLAFAIREFAPKTVDSALFFRSHFVQFLFVSERSGRRKPSAERTALTARGANCLGMLLLVLLLLLLLLLVLVLVLLLVLLVLL